MGAYTLQPRPPRVKIFPVQSSLCQTHPACPAWSSRNRWSLEEAARGSQFPRGPSWPRFSGRAPPRVPLARPQGFPSYAAQLRAPGIDRVRSPAWKNARVAPRTQEGRQGLASQGEPRGTWRFKGGDVSTHTSASPPVLKYSRSRASFAGPQGFPSFEDQLGSPGIVREWTPSRSPGRQGRGRTGRAPRFSSQG